MPHDALLADDLAARLTEAAARCAQNGAQLTALRRDVLTLILQAPGPLTAYQLLDQLKPLRKSAVPPTIYRTLDFLLENRLIHKIERLNAFIPCADGEHEHGHEHAQFLICKNCGSVTEIEDQDVAEALAAVAARRGFVMRRAMVELEGLCAACAGA